MSATTRSGACGVMPNGRPRRLMNAVRIPADPRRARAAPGGWRGDRQKSEDQPHAKGTCPSAAPSPTSCDRLCRIASVFEGILIALRCSSPIAPKFRHCSNSTRCAKTGRETGRRGVVADDARAREVALRHSSYEADEQGGAIRCGAIRGGANRCGAGGAKQLNRHRGKGQQKVTVEHVHVHSGGQAAIALHRSIVSTEQLPSSCDRLCRIASVFEGILIALRCSASGAGGTRGVEGGSSEIRRSTPCKGNLSERSTVSYKGFH